MEQPNAGSFWKDRYASHPGAGAKEPKKTFQDYWDQMRADRAARRGGGGFGGVQPMGGHHGGPTPVIADGGGYGPPPEMSQPSSGHQPSPGHGLGPSNLPQGPSKNDPGWVNPYPGSRPAVPPPGAGVALGSGATMDGPQPIRPPVMAPGGGGGGVPLGSGGMAHGVGIYANKSGSPPPMTRPPVMAPGRPVPPRGAPGGRGGGFGGVRPMPGMTSRATA